MVHARGELANAAAIQLRGAGRQADADGSPASRNLRRGGTAEADCAGTAGISGCAGALVLFELAGWRMAEFQSVRRYTVSQAGARRLARGAAGCVASVVLAAVCFG